MSYWPGILVPIVLFFGLAVALTASMTGDALKNIDKK
jgi:hypothetical protein